MIMLQLGPAQLVAEFLQIGEPLQLADAQAQPIGQIAHGFNHWKVPALRGGDRLHALRFGEPLGDGKFVAVLADGAPESGIFHQEPHHVAMPRARAAGERSI